MTTNIVGNVHSALVKDFGLSPLRLTTNIVGNVHSALVKDFGLSPLSAG